ncbi:unnamed protein product [Medioppia subpectinata]|uniref:VWFA domain-containing protein n=1 Tax=Medioppia subpectinata TaxID=1979941 RepID=A0A7R9PYP8_9ACAR|nr:unnamed protein product [Medioppia subpectinata]CAG2105322.1 unnamed protein product [Medioppia subpectinata]
MSILEFRAQILKNIYPFLEIYVNSLQYFITLSVSSLRTYNKLLSVLLSLFSDLIQNGFCLPQEPSDETNNKEMGTELKDIEDGGLGEGEGTKDVSDKIESEDQLEDALKEGAKEEGKGDENEEKDIDEEDNGIEMENDFEGQAYSPSKGDNEDDEESDGDDSDNNLEDQMGDVDNNSDVLDEKIWGSDEENSDSDETDGEDETGFGGKDTLDNKTVANDENKDLNKDKNSDEKSDEENNENELEMNDKENELQGDDYEDERIDPYKDLEPRIDKSKEELPENMELDDNEDNEEDNDESGEQKDDKSVSGLSDSETEEQNLDEMNASEEEFEENTENNENEDKSKDLENKVEEIEDIDEGKEENISEEKESKPNPSQGMDSTKDQIFNTPDEKTVENENNSSNACVEENTEQKSDQNAGQNEEQHGFSNSLVGDNTTQSESQQLQSSAALDEKELKEEKLNQNMRKDNTRRTLADDYDKSAKRQKIMANENESTSNADPNNENDSKNQMIESQLYRHVDNILDANNKAIDIASNDEKMIQKDNDNESDNKDNIDLNKPEEMDIEEKSELIDTLKPIDVKSEKTQTKSSNKNDGNKEDMTEEAMETEGEIISTLTVQRGNESTFHTHINSDDIHESDDTLIGKRFDDLSFKTINNLDINSVIDVWKECEAKVFPLVYELCERLQLVLEPTKMAKLRGDYRTGKRLNMRKVIAYIASDFRKDKIWLRRTKASKRQYQIVIAVDDSSSMSDNKSKQLAFESLALLGKSLTLLEAGELAIMSFGQTVRLLHHFNEAFNENTGANLLTQLTFEQKETRIADLLQSVEQLMSTSRRPTGSQKEDISQLLIIVSDGRGIYSEGEQRVRQSIRKMKELGIFVVFVVIDNPLNKDSILDIRVPIFSGAGNVKIESYMERFPFQFYILLRDINGLPVVMGEALRQWFELITSGQT